MTPAKGSQTHRASSLPASKVCNDLAFDGRQFDQSGATPFRMSAEQSIPERWSLDAQLLPPCASIGRALM